MAILSALQSAAMRLMGQRPGAFYTAADTFEMEIADLANETALNIARAHDWQRLTKLRVINGDGVSAGYNLPDDYDRMTLAGEVHSASWTTWRYIPVRDLDSWLDYRNGLAIARPGSWIITGGQMQFWPILNTGENAQFYYISSQWAASAGGAPKSAFTADDDQWLLDPQLLTLGLIWRWRSQKRLEYAEDLSNYEIALADRIAKDKGARVLASGRKRFPAAVATPYPGALGQ